VTNKIKLYLAKNKPYVDVIQKCCCFLKAKAYLKWTEAKSKTVLCGLQNKEDRDHLVCYQCSVQKPTSNVGVLVPVELATCTSGKAPSTVKGIFKF